MTVSETPRPTSPLGVVIVAFHSADVILDCLESVLAGPSPRPRIVVVDNASPDATVAAIRDWAAGTSGHAAPTDVPFALDPVAKPLRVAEADAGDPAVADADVVILHVAANRGFAGGVNIGLAHLAASADVRHFWVLNPDAMAAPGTVEALLARAAEVPGYGLMGGRVCYAHAPHQIQIDGGTINRRTGVTGNLNLGRDPATTPVPDASRLDFVMGAHLMVSRSFYERVGPMREDYFLYYEEVDWACRRGDLPLVQAADAVVYHRAGTSIGSPTLERLASPFSIWFKHRGRMRFMRRFHPGALPVAWAYGMAKAMQMAARRAWPQAGAILSAVNGLPPPRAVRARLTPEAAKIAFGRPVD